MTIAILNIFGCWRPEASTGEVLPGHFKVEVPFMLDKRGIIVNTYWGKQRTHHVLCLDNLSPSWVDTSVSNHDHSLVRSSNLKFETLTADGTRVHGDVEYCDSLFFEGVEFRAVPFYVMPNNFGHLNSDDGVFGGDLMSRGIWEIDFRRRILTFTSELDSLRDIANSEILPAVFNKDNIKIDVELGKGVVKTAAIDLGYHGDIILPMEDFLAIRTANKKFSRPSEFMTPASASVVNDLYFFDTIKLNNNWFHVMVSSNEKVKERLVGVEFFDRFDFVVFDFKNSKIHISKKVW
ncbi:MAG TPA: hypothetical protein VMH27_20485 [Puia sp.]|nr:hypothetical protein [Puia sp.]